MTKIYILLSIILIGQCDRISFCDVVIAGGSASALAAAMASAESGVQTCLLEPTNWPGGQMTASGVPAIDFAWRNQRSGNSTLNNKRYSEDLRNNGRVFSWFLQHPIMSTGMCWVSDYCYLPKQFLEQLIWPTLRSLSGKLSVFLNTVPKAIVRDERRIIQLEAIQRQSISEECQLLHEELPDWYSVEDSEYFKKQVLQFDVDVIVDGTEWGEILVLSGASYMQGTQNQKLQGDPQCGQMITFGFAQQVNNNSIEQIESPYKFDHPEYYSLQGKEFDSIWTYRRLYTEGKQTMKLDESDISLQNWETGNDYAYGYLLQDQVDISNYEGGVNLGVLEQAEYEAFGWHYYLKNHTKHKIEISKETFGTCHGLSKMPYMRDTRRSIGLDDFILRIEQISGSFPDKQFGEKFEDAVALGSYDTDVHFLLTCTYPEEMQGDLSKKYPPLPFYIPFRSLTNKDFDNLLVAGKTISQEFLVNSNTRLHPEEWNTGTAAGVAASFMTKLKLTSQQVYDDHIAELQKEIIKYQPIDWAI